MGRFATEMAPHRTRRYRPEYSNPKPPEQTQNWIKIVPQHGIILRPQMGIADGWVSKWADIHPDLYPILIRPLSGL